MKIFVFFCFIFLFNNCHVKESADSYESIMYDIDEDCTLSVVRFNTSGLYERIAISGYCKAISSQKYLDAVQNHFEATKFDTLSSSGEILFEFYGFPNSDTLQKEFLKLTKPSKIVDISETRITISFRKS